MNNDSDLISRSKLLDRLYRDGEGLDRVNGNEHFINGVELALDVIHDEPAVDAEPVVHAHWVLTIQNKVSNVHCSRCKLPKKCWQNITKFCPECGASMDEKVEVIKVTESGPVGMNGPIGLCPSCKSTRIVWDATDDTNRCANCGWTDRCKNPVQDFIGNLDGGKQDV